MVGTPLNRDDRLDILRGIGLLCIVLAHVEPPAVLFQLRNFDVPLLVLVSGSAYAMSAAGRPKIGYIKYLGARFARLIIPTWIFLVIFFTAALLASYILHKSYPFSSEEILSSFLLMDGIGYVWIIRVFLLVSLIAPLTNLASRSPEITRLAYMVALVVYIIYEIIVHYVPKPNMALSKVLLEDILYMLMPYGCIFWLGTRLPTMNEKKLLAYSIISLFLFAAIGAAVYEMTGSVAQTQRYKYPPTAYYISYAMSVAIGGYWLVGNAIFSSAPARSHIAFLGRSSLWIYLWHIGILYFIQWTNINLNFAIKFITILGVSIIIVLVQGVVLEKVLESIDSQRLKKVLRSVFSG